MIALTSFIYMLIFLFIHLVTGNIEAMDYWVSALIIFFIDWVWTTSYPFKRV